MPMIVISEFHEFVARLFNKFEAAIVTPVVFRRKRNKVFTVEFAKNITMIAACGQSAAKNGGDVVANVCLFCNSGAHYRFSVCFNYTIRCHTNSVSRFIEYVSSFRDKHNVSPLSIIATLFLRSVNNEHVHL